MSKVADSFLEICQSIVSKSDEVQVSGEETGDLEKIRISVAKEDMGTIIGKGGRVIKALRKLAGVLGVKSGKKVIVELEESV